MLSAIPIGTRVRAWNPARQEWIRGRISAVPDASGPLYVIAPSDASVSIFAADRPQIWPEESLAGINKPAGLDSDAVLVERGVTRTRAGSLFVLPTIQAAIDAARQTPVGLVEALNAAMRDEAKECGNLRAALDKANAEIATLKAAASQERADWQRMRELRKENRALRDLVSARDQVREDALRSVGEHAARAAKESGRADALAAALEKACYAIDTQLSPMSAEDRDTLAGWRALARGDAPPSTREGTLQVLLAAAIALRARCLSIKTEIDADDRAALDRLYSVVERLEPKWFDLVPKSESPEPKRVDIRGLDSPHGLSAWQLDGLRNAFNFQGPESRDARRLLRRAGLVVEAVRLVGGEWFVHVSRAPAPHAWKVGDRAMWRGSKLFPGIGEDFEVTIAGVHGGHVHLVRTAAGATLDPSFMPSILEPIGGAP